MQVTESKDSREWTLHVKSPLAKDSGIYECQVNTEPKMSMAFQLNIIGKYARTYTHLHAHRGSVKYMKYAEKFVVYDLCLHVHNCRACRGQTPLTKREPVELLIKNCNSVYLRQQRTIMLHSFVYFSVGIKF